MSNDQSQIDVTSESSDEGVPRKEVEELLFQSAHLRRWEADVLTPLLLTYYPYAKAIHEVVVTGSIKEAAHLARVSESSTRRANAVGAHTDEWFLEKWAHRSKAGDRLTRRHIEALAVATLSQEKAAFADAQTRVGGSRKMEEATRRKKRPLRANLESGVAEPLAEPPASGTFPSRGELAKTRPRKVDGASQEDKKSKQQTGAGRPYPGSGADAEDTASE